MYFYIYLFVSNRFACSASVSTIAGMQKEKEMLLQGQLGYEIEIYLHEHCGIPKSLIDITSTKGLKKKK